MGNESTAIWNGHVKVGVLGAGQLGKMMAIEAANWHLPFEVMDKDSHFPAAPYASRFVQGDFKNEADVLRFGRQVDILTIEIEHVHIGALRQLQTEGVLVYPDPSALDIIIDKGKQKQFYAEKGIPTSLFQLFSGKEAIKAGLQDGLIKFPFVQKSRTGGYDGRGVSIIKNEEDLLTKLLPGASMVEDLVDIEVELAVIVARNARGEMKSFPLVEMVFDQEANLVDYLQTPTSVSSEVAKKAIEIAEATAIAYNISGVLAIELFLTKAGEVLVNEVAPRPHNSGHHTIESCPTSQFAQHIRAILNLPLGDTSLLQPAVMLNLLGEQGFTGAVVYEGMDEVMAMPNVFVHLYGKKETRPFRKMGHLTILGKTIDEALEKAKKVKKLVKCKSS